KPLYERISIESLAFRDGGIDVKAIFRNLSVGIDLVPDRDGDGEADSDPLPLVVALGRRSPSSR
ncbi:MAG TPA: hypothetical protein PLY45_05890, partial [bacterium]|nr:hypothetical protein [bacterium]